MSTATSEVQRIPICDVRRGDLVEICEYSELWLKVRYVHPLPGEHCYRIDGTVYDRDLCQREATIDFPDTETPRRAPTPLPLTSWTVIAQVLRRVPQLILRH